MGESIHFLAAEPLSRRLCARPVPAQHGGTAPLLPVASSAAEVCCADGGGIWRRIFFLSESVVHLPGGVSLSTPMVRRHRSHRERLRVHPQGDVLCSVRDMRNEVGLALLWWHLPRIRTASSKERSKGTGRSSIHPVTACMCEIMDRVRIPCRYRPVAVC